MPVLVYGVLTLALPTSETVMVRVCTLFDSWKASAPTVAVTMPSGLTRSVVDASKFTFLTSTRALVLQRW